MLSVDAIDVWGFDHAIRGMRNPMNSWDKSDSYYESANYFDSEYVVGDADLVLMHRLYEAGSEHRKYLRQIFVSMDIVAPLYWWKEFDTYKVGTVSNSCSTMHKIAEKVFEPIDFSIEHLSLASLGVFNTVLAGLNLARDSYLETKSKDDWWQMIQLLPSAYNQRRTITMNYENVMTIIKQRSGHKLDEWNMLVEELKALPYVEEIRNGFEVR